MTKRIFIKDWLILKPYDKQALTDSYYLNISNQVHDGILKNTSRSALLSYITDEDFKQLACFLTSYFEDIISNTNIWNSFIRINKRHYKKVLPFYDLTDYVEEEINTQDISFLIWYFLNTAQTEKFIVASNEFIIPIAETVMEVFEEAWEYAPVNEVLQNYYHIAHTENDFYVARNLITKLLFKTYLFKYDIVTDLEEQELNIINQYPDDDNLLSFLNENYDILLHTSHTRLLALKGKEWVSEILGSTHPLHSDFINMSEKISGHFLYKGQDSTDIFIEHIASGKKFKLTKKSFSHSEDFREVDSILYIGIVRWKEEWWFSGIFHQRPFNADFILDQKNSHQSRSAVNFLDHQNSLMQEMLEGQMKTFLDFTGGLQMAFMPSEKVNDFLNQYTRFYNESLKLTQIEHEEARTRASKEGFFHSENEPLDFAKISSTALVFFNPKSGCEIALGVNSAFPLPYNPYFDRDLSVEHIMRLLMNEEISVELVKFCIDNCANKLPFFQMDIGQQSLKDIDFLLRFWKKNNYHTKPAITITGQNETSSQYV